MMKRTFPKKSNVEQKQKEQPSDDVALEEQEQYDVDHDDSDDDFSSEEEGEDLILEGVLVRNPNVESSDDSDEHYDDDDDDDDSIYEKDDNVQPVSKKTKTLKMDDGNHQGKQDETSHKESDFIIKKKKKEKKKTNQRKDRETEIIPVEFTFHDMDEKYFHGIKNFLLSHPVYASHSSSFADVIIDNIAVGTVVSTDDGQDNVFGFASVLNISTYSSTDSVQAFKELCLEACPEEHKHEMETVLSGKTKRPVGIFIHGRMVNLPLEITHVLHEQLVKDMEWAVDNAEGGEEERKSLNFGAFVLLAPCQRDHVDGASGIVYKNFDDEIFAQCAEFVYPMNPQICRGSKKSGQKELDHSNKDKNKKKSASLSVESQVDTGLSDKDFVNVIVLTRTGHETAMKDLNRLINGGR